MLFVIAVVLAAVAVVAVVAVAAFKFATSVVEVTVNGAVPFAIFDTNTHDELIDAKVVPSFIQSCILTD